jgi:hypothetical protein
MNSKNNVMKKANIEIVMRKAVLFDHPEFIPMRFSASGPTWNSYPHEFVLEQMAALFLMPYTTCRPKHRLKILLR